MSSTLAFVAAALCLGANPALISAREALARGDVPAAVDSVETALREAPGDDDLELLLAALLVDPAPARADELRVAANAPALPPLPTLAPEVPAAAGQDAFVNVASAAVRAKPHESAKLLARLPIGTQVKVERLAGEFAKVRLRLPSGKAKAGFIRRDLLAGRRPTLESLLSAEEAAKAKGPDAQLTVLWRALNLDPKRQDVYERLLVLAFSTRRYDLALDAVRLASRAERWLDPTMRFATPEALRAHLYRAALAGSPDAIGPLLQDLKRKVSTDFDVVEVPASVYFEGTMRKPASELWRILEGVLLSPKTRSQERWSFQASGHRVDLGVEGVEGWRVIVFDLPGGHYENETGGTWDWEERLRFEGEQQEQAAAPGGSLHAQPGTPVVTGSMDAVLARKALERGWPPAAVCLEGWAPQIGVQLKLVIAASGDVSSVTLVPEGLAPERVQCLKQKAAAWHFPKARGGGITVLMVPLVFAP